MRRTTMLSGLLLILLLGGPKGMVMSGQAKHLVVLETGLR